jgi:hypothetical protein
VCCVGYGELLEGEILFFRLDCGEVLGSLDNCWGPCRRRRLKTTDQSAVNENGGLDNPEWMSILKYDVASWWSFVPVLNNIS